MKGRQGHKGYCCVLASSPVEASRPTAVLCALILVSTVVLLFVGVFADAAVVFAAEDAAETVVLPGGG